MEKTKIVLKVFGLLVLLVCWAGPSFAETERGDYERCLLEAARDGSEQRTVGQLREDCRLQVGLSEIQNQIPAETDAAAGDELSVIENRKAIEDLAQELPYLLVPHKPNYLLPISYNESSNDELFAEQDLNLDPAEVKFQLSIKTRVIKGLFFGEGDVWAGYTNLSFWQAYNGDRSSPFRETNHEPEIFIDFHPSIEFAGWESNLLRFGAVHQSNGRGGVSSRSWNRLYALMSIERDRWNFSLRPWYRIPESGKDSDEDPGGDDNPDIHKFLGYGEVSSYYRGDVYRFGATFRNNLRSNNRIGLLLDWSFPLTERLRGYLQYFNGYGESLIDYDDSTNRIGLGFVFSEAL